MGRKKYENENDAYYFKLFDFFTCKNRTVGNKSVRNVFDKETNNQKLKFFFFLF